MKNKLAQLTDKQKLAWVASIVLVFALVGIGVWVYDTYAAGQDESPQTQTPAQPGPEAVNAAPGPSVTDTEEPSESPSPTASAEGVSQEESAKQALESVVPVWASLDVREVGQDRDKWVDSWRDEPGVSSSFATQSRNNFVSLFKGILNLDVDAKVDTLKSIENVWQEGNLSGWNVTMDRRLVSPDGSDVVDETETVMWEFVVEQQSDGSSQLTGYSSVSVSHDDDDEHDH